MKDRKQNTVTNGRGYIDAVIRKHSDSGGDFVIRVQVSAEVRGDEVSERYT